MSQHWNYLSVIPPSGLSPSAVIACYQFDGPALGLTDRTGNGHNLSRIGTEHAWVAMKAENGCNAAVIYNNTDHLETGISDALISLGAATVEMVIARYRIADLTNIRNYYFICGGTGEGANDNIVFSAYGSNIRNRLGILVEKDSGTDIIGDSPGYWQPCIPGSFNYLAIAREADGVTYHVYSDGNFIEDIVLSDPPTCTTPSTVTLSIGEVFGGLVINSLRWTHATLDASQIEATYQQLRAR